MGLFRQADAPTNATVQAVPVYTTDPHGEAMFAGILAGTLGHLSGGRAVIDSNRRAWHGWTKAPQGFRGALGGGGGRPVVPPTSRLDQQQGSTTAPDVVQQIFESRASAGRFE